MSSFIGRSAAAAGLFLIITAPAAFAGNSVIQILSATIRDQKIAGATVILQRNGERSSAGLSDSVGQVQVDQATANDPAALVIVQQAGYSELVAKCPCGGMTYALSPRMQNLDGMRIVLNWGASPRDLDGHLVFAQNHVWFSNKTGDDAMLDIDHIDGFGPETITLARKHAGERYEYAVQDYSHKEDPNADGLSHSDAKVFVYIGQTLIRTYYVPKNRVGNVWRVFAVSGEGEIQDIDTVSSIAVTASAELTPETIFGSRYATATGPAARSPETEGSEQPVLSSAKKLNSQGEAAYRAGDLTEATRLFQLAIAQSDAYGQAYSNLGLAFQKSGRVAEALWANRKAIALAHGPNASNTRASTHFNNGRIYEDAAQWSDALREYEMARSEKSNLTYDNAVERMHGHGVR